jgi:hypothetical protein
MGGLIIEGFGAIAHVDLAATGNLGLPLPRAARAHVGAASPLATHVNQARASTALGKTAGAQPPPGASTCELGHPK